VSGVHTLVASAMNHDALLYPYVRVDIDGSWVNADQYAKAIAAIREQAQEIARLDRIACYVPAKVYIAAQEKAGFGVEVKAI